jgi:hypothetical protein
MRCLFIVTLALCASVAPAHADSVTYTYDSYGRVQTVLYTNGTKIIYNYDNADNRVTQTVTCTASPC